MILEFSIDLIFPRFDPFSWDLSDKVNQQGSAECRHRGLEVWTKIAQALKVNEFFMFSALNGKFTLLTNNVSPADIGQVADNQKGWLFP